MEIEDGEHRQSKPENALPPSFTEKPPALKAGHEAQLWLCTLDGDKRLVHRTMQNLIEAPNWTRDGELIVNAAGRLWRIAIDGTAKMQEIPIEGAGLINNDHVLAPDGNTCFVTSRDGRLFAVPLNGGRARVISNRYVDRDFRYFLHGISPDGEALAYVGMERFADGRPARLNIYTIPAAGGADRQLTDALEPEDGPEYSHDGRWIYFNSERGARRPGDAQIYRMPANGGPVTPITTDNRVNWFPHPSPDGRWLLYLSYAEGTIGHPAYKDVILRMMDLRDGTLRDMAAITGGQGTINVNSWAPDASAFAYCSYPLGTCP